MISEAPYLYLLAYLTAINYFPEIYENIPVSMETFMFLQHAFCLLAVHYLIATIIYMITSLQYRLTRPNPPIENNTQIQNNIENPNETEDQRTQNNNENQKTQNDKENQNERNSRLPVQPKEIQMIKSLVNNPEMLNDFKEMINPYISLKSEGDLTIIFNNDEYQNAKLKIKTPEGFSLYSFLFTKYKKTSYEWCLEEMIPSKENKQILIGNVYLKDNSTKIKFIHEFNMIKSLADSKSSLFQDPNVSDIEYISDSE